MENRKKTLEEYSVLRAKYNLPEFEQLCEDFDIEKSLETETRFILREIRRSIHEKLSAYLHLLETLINPSAPPMFIFSIIRGLGDSEKERIREAYKSLSKLQLYVMKLDVLYNEENESRYIKESFEKWQEIKKSLIEIIEKLEEGLEQDNDSKKSAYFG